MLYRLVWEQTATSFDERYLRSSSRSWQTGSPAKAPEGNGSDPEHVTVVSRAAAYRGYRLLMVMKSVGDAF